MYRNTLFRELLKGYGRARFERLVDELGADKYSKGFRCWDQLVAMIYAQLTGCVSLRELEAGLNSQAAHHYHLGTRSIRRSTLADANAKRGAELFARVVEELLASAHRRARRELKDLLYLLDSTLITLKGQGYDGWAGQTRTEQTQGLKVHVMMTPQEATPVLAQISDANVNDLNVGRALVLEPGAMYVFDKGYCDYNWWYEIEQAEAHFVTRFKTNASIEVRQARALGPEVPDEIQADEVVEFRNRRPGGKRINHYHGTPLRRVVVRRPDKDTPLVLATNDFTRPAHEIAALYKRRWAIELFFKWLKQNLKIKRYLGRSENAVKIQIYCALIAYLLLQAYRRRHGLTQSMKLCLVSIRSRLFQRTELESEAYRKHRLRRQALFKQQGELALA